MNDFSAIPFILCAIKPDSEAPRKQEASAPSTIWIKNIDTLEDPINLMNSFIDIEIGAPLLFDQI